jgi:hypothetical protein
LNPAFAGNEVVCQIGMSLMTVRTLEPSCIDAMLECVRALAGGRFSSLDGESLQTRLTFN